MPWAMAGRTAFILHRRATTSSPNSYASGTRSIGRSKPWKTRPAFHSSGRWRKRPGRLKGRALPSACGRRTVSDRTPPPNWFESGGKAYAAFRPDYPDALVAYLGEIAPDQGLAVDVGCGTGQLTALLAQHFRKVVGIDPSAEQLANASQHPLVEYAQAH